MAYKYYNLNNLRGEEPRGIDRWFQRILLSVFSERTARGIYGVTIDIIAFFAKVWLWMTLPFVFLKFWKTNYKKHLKESENNNYRK